MTSTNAAIEARATVLLRDANTRWLVKEELAFLLQHHARLGVPIERQLQLQPPSTFFRRECLLVVSLCNERLYKTLTVYGLMCMKYVLLLVVGGRLLMYDTRDVSEFKKDGWQWQKRKDQSGRVRLHTTRVVYMFDIGLWCSNRVRMTYCIMCIRVLRCVDSRRPRQAGDQPRSDRARHVRPLGWRCGTCLCIGGFLYAALCLSFMYGEVF